MANDDALHEWQQRCYALVDENEGLKQQLAQAREANGLLAIKNGKLGRERDQARALLQDALPHCYRAGDVAFAHKIVAFLADHPTK